MEYYKEESEK